MGELVPQHRTSFTTRCEEYLQLFRNSPLLAQGVVVQNRKGRPFYERHHHAELRLNTVVVFRSKDQASKAEVGPTDIINVLTIFEYAIHLEQSDKEARVYFKTKDRTNKNVIFIQTTLPEMRRWKAGLELALTRRIPSLSDIRVLRCIGKGGFGKVFLVKLLSDNNYMNNTGSRMSPRSVADLAMRHIDEEHSEGNKAKNRIGASPYFALKVLPKRAAFKSRTNLHHIITERNLLESLKGPYYLPLSFAFQTENNFYFGTPLCAGGDLGSYLKRKGVLEIEFPALMESCDPVLVLQGLPEKTVRNLGAQVVVGLCNMHKMGVMYRDLKPENLFVEPNGNLRFGDFGLARVLPPLTKDEERNDGTSNRSRTRMRLKQRATTKCGTKYYKAPEVGREEYTFSADIWSFGVLLYNLLTGKLPFSPCDNHRHSDRREECAQVQHLFFPDAVSANARSLLTKLLQIEPDSRPSFSQIKRHRFFRHVLWEVVEKAKGATALPDVMNRVDIADAKACCEFALRAAELMPCSNEMLDDNEDSGEQSGDGSGEVDWGLIGFEYGVQDRAVEPLKVCFRKGGFQWFGGSVGWPWTRIENEGMDCTK